VPRERLHGAENPVSARHRLKDLSELRDMSESRRGTARRAFIPLPLGRVRPLGWLKEQLEIQRDGLFGRLEEVWQRPGPENGRLGGKGDGGEIVPCYLDGIVPLAYLLDDSGLKKKVRKWMDRILNNSDGNGLPGPETGRPGRWWPGAVMLKALAQYAEASGDERVEPAMAAYLMNMYKNLPETPLGEQGKFRWGEYLVSIIWLSDRMTCPVLTRLALVLRKQGYDWVDHFRYFRIEGAVRENPNMASQAVNHAMAAKYPALWSLFSGRAGDGKASDTAVAMLDRFHGCATGLFTGDGHLAGKNPSRGTELCAVVEYMYSLEVLSSLLGEAAYADRLESLCYNNLPAAFTADMRACQCVQQANQVLCSIDERAWTSGGDANVFGPGLNHPCCTADFGQGWPKFVSHAWMGIPGGGLAAVALGPSEVNVEIGGVRVAVKETTGYPFTGEIEFEVKTSSAVSFPLAVRVPGWAVGAEISLNGETPRPVVPGRYHILTRTWRKKERVVLVLPMRVRISRRYNDSVAVHRGPLTFALKIESEWRRVRGKKPAADYEVYPRSKWNYALVVEPGGETPLFGVEEKAVKMPCFSGEKAPVVLTAKAREVPFWRMEGVSAAPPPPGLVATSAPVEEVRLVPYGSAKLRITEFPVTGI